MADNSHLYAVIMAGGRGTRFWPLSRESRPKQVLPIAGPEPMIRTAVDRVLPLTQAERVLVMTGAAHAKRVKDILPDLPPENIIAEPVGRDTAPCIGLAAHVIRDRDRGGIMIVLPADHIITNTAVFRDLVLAGASLAGREKALVTLGVKPTHPETGYGYIEAGTRGLEIQGHTAWPALAFHEKPGRGKAREYLADERFYWNSGIFIWEALTILKQMQKLMPGLAGSLESLAEHWGGDNFETAINRIYPQLESISIDYGVMEKA
ncbi:MAG: mannose-1-phosphate guanylyltransferase, partial [Thermodesulfobacteriota bacterium]|nr:mannose-1-phosphate guanylyltransferase [Thermodesulfobacteriota bacterium]